MQYLLSLLPVLACPVGMGLMMWLIMRQGKEHTPPAAEKQQEDRPVAAPLASPVTSTPVSSQHPSPIGADFKKKRGKSDERGLFMRK